MRVLPRYAAIGALALASCGPSSSATTIDGCADTDFVDLRTSSANITWTFQVTPHCVEISAGQTVTWTGSFATHPLQADQGDAPNPIAGANESGASTTVTFPTAGTFGFKCQVHSSMIGAVRVVP